MSIRYIQSLRYHIQQCEFLLQVTGTTDGGDLEEERLEAMDFLYDLRSGYEREIADVSADMARREGVVV
jgi:hypothetical protein